MSKIIHLYIFDKNELSVKRIDNINISQEHLNKCLNDPKIDTMAITSQYSKSNHILKTVLNTCCIWVSIYEGSVLPLTKETPGYMPTISFSNRNSLWLSEVNDTIAIQKFLEYESNSLKTWIRDYEKFFKQYSNRINYLRSEIVNPKLEYYTAISQNQFL